MTIAEKILATKSGRTSVAPREIVEAFPDLVMSHTATWRSVRVMQRIGASREAPAAPYQPHCILGHAEPTPKAMMAGRVGFTDALKPVPH